MSMPNVDITANPAGLSRASDDLELAAQRCLHVAEALAAVDTSGWTTQTADAFRDRMEDEPERWATMAQAFRAVSRASESFAHDVTITKRQLADAKADAEHLRNFQSMLGPEDATTENVRPQIDQADAEIMAVARKFDAAADEFTREVRTAANLARPAPSGWHYVGRAFIGAKEMLWDDLVVPTFSGIWKACNREFPESEALGVGMLWAGLGDLWNAAVDDPLKTGEAIWQSLIDPFFDNPGYATGEVLGGFVPFAGTGVKVGTSVVKVTRKVGGVRPTKTPPAAPKIKPKNPSTATVVGGAAAAKATHSVISKSVAKKHAAKAGNPIKAPTPAAIPIHPRQVNKNDPASFRHEPGVEFKPVSTVRADHNSFNPHGHAVYKTSTTHPTGPKSFEDTKLQTTDGRYFKAEDWPYLTAKDLQNIYDYTLETFAEFPEYNAPTSYQIMNGAVRSNKDVEPEVSDAIRNLNASLEKIPAKPGTYYRVLNGFPNWESVFSKGEVFTDSFMSTSDRFLDSFYEESVEKATQDTRFPVIKMTVHSQSGRHLPVTAIPGENEVLHPAGTRFRVNSVEKISDDPPEYLIDVTEVP